MVGAFAEVYDMMGPWGEYEDATWFEWDYDTGQPVEVDWYVSSRVGGAVSSSDVCGNTVQVDRFVPYGTFRCCKD